MVGGIRKFWETWRARQGLDRARGFAGAGRIDEAVACQRRVFATDPNCIDPFARNAVPHDFREEWDAALRLPGQQDLRRSLAQEVAGYRNVSVEEAETLLRAPLSDAWQRPDYGASELRELYASDEDWPIANLRFANSDRNVLARVYATQLAVDRGSKHALDFGSGPGNMALYFAAKDLDVSCADVSIPGLALCRWRFERRGLAPPSVFDAEKDELPEETFDLVAAFDVFEVLPESTQPIAKLVRALAPGGLLAISTGIDRAHGAGNQGFVIGCPVEEVIHEAIRHGLRPLATALIRKKSLWLLEKPS